MKPYCFVLMPFGKKNDENGNSIDFDEVYSQIIRPSIENAELEPIRADEEKYGGIIHKPMFERLMMCEYAIADLTTANANVFYELGIRHGVRPHSTTLIFSKKMRLPFDVSPLRALPYKLNEQGLPCNADDDINNLTQLLLDSRDPIDDSPVYQLIHDMPRFDISRLKTDSFRDSIAYEKDLKSRIAHARIEGPESIQKIQSDLKLQDTDPSVLIDLLLSYRAVEAWQPMVDLVRCLPAPLSSAILVREQLGFALNRLKKHTEAEAVLKELIFEYGTSSETNGILGRVYKDQWSAAAEAQSPASAGYLAKAIDTYLAGFEMDWRDAYPGINAATLMEMQESPDIRQSQILPVVRYSVERRLKGKQPDFWDFATLLEIAVLDSDQAEANRLLGLCLAEIRESWEPKSTANNIRLIREKRESRGEETQWLLELEHALDSYQ